jgi:hypothetical protein
MEEILHHLGWFFKPILGFSAPIHWFLGFLAEK